MNCISCKIELPPSFRHAFEKNICPACGEEIMDEESLALMEDISSTLLGEAKLRDDTARRLAMALLTKYNISSNTTMKPRQEMKVEQKQEVERQMKIAEPSFAQKIEKSMVVSADVVNGISDEEREQIMAEAVSEKYGLYNDGMIQSEDNDDFQEYESDFNVEEVPNRNTGLSSMFDSSDGVLEKERQMRLAKQRAALSGGGKSSFRRG